VATDERPKLRKTYLKQKNKKCQQGRCKCKDCKGKGDKGIGNPKTTEAIHSSGGYVVHTDPNAGRITARLSILSLITCTIELLTAQ
jgi:hypothetical protein